MIETRYSPTRRDLILIALAAFVLRFVALAVMAHKAHLPLEEMPYRSDGTAYIDNAKRINGDGMPSAYDQRVFVGYPWLLAIAHRVGVPYTWGSQVIGWAIPALLCVAAAAWLKDKRIGWGLAILPPHWVLDSACVMNESLMLLLCVTAMMALRRPAWWGVGLAGLSFAAAGVVRPMACFAVAGALAFLLQARQPKRAVGVAVVTVVLLAALLGAFAAVYWNPLDNAKAYNTEELAYNGHLFTYPFGSFVETARTRGLLKPNFIYKASYMVAAAGVLLLAIWRWRKNRQPLDAWAATWWGTNFAFVACIGSHWGVDIAQRSLMWAAPAAYWTVRDYLPTRWWSRLAWAMLPIPWVYITTQA